MFVITKVFVITIVIYMFTTHPPTCAPVYHVAADWTSMASSTDGTKIVAVTTTARGTIWASSDSGVSWKSRASGLPGDMYFKDVTSSANGAKLALVGYGAGYVGYVYTSNNNGTSWSNSDASSLLTNVSRNVYQISTRTDWHISLMSIKSSADGTYLALAVEGRGIYTSNNSGANWTLTSAGPLDWSCIAMSSDGTKLVAGVTAGALYTSINGGASWTVRKSGFYGGGPTYTWISQVESSQTAIRPSTIGRILLPDVSFYWSSLAISDNGARIVAGTEDTIYVWISTNSGANWQACQPWPTYYFGWANVSPLTGLRSVRMSPDGIKIAFLSHQYGLYTDMTYIGGDVLGTQMLGLVTIKSFVPNWYIYGKDGNGFTAMTSSSKGTNFAIAVNVGGIYTSFDNGTSWARGYST